MKKVIDYLSVKLDIDNKALLEKDIILHQLLQELIQDRFFHENFVFKGGTCLTKCYLGYYLFSEDLDFTWKDQHLFSAQSQKEIRKALSTKITTILQLLQKIAQKLHLDFNPDKTDKKYIELGGSNKFSTFKLWYTSKMSGMEQFIKVQINFVELFVYPFKELPAKSILLGISEKEFTFLFPEEAASLLDMPKVNCYSLSEILVEKFRAILTRKVIKARDFVDVFIIIRKNKINLQTIRPEIIRKTAFMLRYDKYVQNLKEFNLKHLMLGEEQKLLLRPLDSGFDNFLQEIQDFLSGLTEELQNRKT